MPPIVKKSQRPTADICNTKIFFWQKQNGLLQDFSKNNIRIAENSS